MKIAINNRQNELRINKRAARKLACFLMQKASSLLPEREWSEVSIVIADDKLMSSVNLAFTGTDGTTDVLSFCLPPMSPLPESYTGEVFVNAQTAAERPGNSARELALYIAHGCDHLMDEDDSDEKSRKRMRNRELRWLREADTLNLIDDLTSPTGKGQKEKQ